MKRGVFCFNRERAGSTGRSGKAVLLPLLTSLLFLLCFTGSAGASIARYDVVSGTDNLGNPVSGSVYVDSEPSDDFWLGFDIVGYEFHSDTLDYAGSERSFICFWPGIWFPDAPEVLAGFSWVHLGEWGNALGGVFFYDQVMGDVEATREDYSTLHQYLQIGGLNRHRSWLGGSVPYGLGTFVLQLAGSDPPNPAPAPSALLLLAPGLAGLALARRRFCTGRDKGRVSS